MARTAIGHTQVIEYQDEYTMRDVEDMFGVGRTAVLSWIRTGWLQFLRNDSKSDRNIEPVFAYEQLRDCAYARGAGRVVMTRDGATERVEEYEHNLQVTKFDKGQIIRWVADWRTPKYIGVIAEVDKQAKRVMVSRFDKDKTTTEWIPMDEIELLV